MTGLPDRPAAELLAQWESLPLTYTGDREVHWQVFTRMYMDDVLERLARAEQALADVDALHLLGDFEMCTCCGEFPFPCRTIAALRASQGGQNKCPAIGDHESQWFEDEQSWRCLRCGRYFSNDAPVRASQGGQ